MSIELGIIKNKGAKGPMDGDLKITQFYGGKENGAMIQLTQGVGTFINMDEPGFIQLTANGAFNVGKELIKWSKTQKGEKNEKGNLEI